MIAEKKLNKAQLHRTGIRDAINVPGFALFSTMVGFSTIAKEAGFDIWMIAATTLSVWGMPGQVAFASLYATGASLFVMFLAVFLANMRMMLMVITGFNIFRLDMHPIPFWKKILLVHVMAITSWAQIGYIKEKYPPPQLLYYYIGFSLTIYVFGFLGSLLGYFVDGIVSPESLRIIIFMTPLYILLLVINAKEKMNRFAVLVGGLIIPLIYPIFGSWSILLGGFCGGSLAFITFSRSTE